ncbi:MAG: hypothetical protein M1820_010806 [Bogoriella megaspora]|nr:MAG: hypothetical protein M1820_010806 [Bogoriella megaspora]
MADGNSQVSHSSQTAQEFINSQLQLEADAREALPYQFDSCTKPLGALRQKLFSCLTCNPPPSNPSDPYIPAGVCYSCSISCHGEHTLVELFNKRNFVCDCGTTRLPATSPCTLRANQETGTKGVHSEKPHSGNKYNHNFQGRFCDCGEDYDPHTEKGTMFQCVGLGTVEDGGCGEDWWHPECVLGLPRDWNRGQKSNTNGATNDSNEVVNGNNESKSEEQPTTETNGTNVDQGLGEDDEPPMPPGFPPEDDFEHFVCYKCVDAFPWIKRYAGTIGFLPAVPVIDQSDELTINGAEEKEAPTVPRKRKSDEIEDEEPPKSPSKRQRSSEDDGPTTNSEVPESIKTTNAVETNPSCIYESLPPAPSERISLFLKDDFRPHLCRCPKHFPLLTPHPALLDEEASYSPPLSRSSSPAPGSVSAGSKSLLERGEAALSNVDRVRAIEGVMVYNHLRDKVKEFLKPYAESGEAVGAEDIKKYFEKLRGDEEGIKQAGAGGEEGGGDGEGEGDNRKEQSGQDMVPALHIAYEQDLMNFLLATNSEIKSQFQAMGPQDTRNAVRA